MHPAPSRLASILLALSILLPAPGCVMRRLQRDHRRPWSHRTSTTEDAAYAVEVGLSAVAVVATLGLLNPFERDWTSWNNAPGWNLDDDDGFDFTDDEEEEEGHSDRQDPTFGPRVTGRRRDRGGR